MPSAVLLSGGLDSAVLLAEEAARDQVQPVYVSVGLAWEAAERAMLSALLGHDVLRGRVRPLVSLAVDMRDVYPATHWAVEGRPPAYNTPDEDVYLPGRNIVLLGKAAVYCAAAGLDRIVLGTLGHNPFPDATPAFREAMADAMSHGLAHRLRIEAPYAALGKPAVVRRGFALGVPLELTMSCMNPQVRRPVQGVQGVHMVHQVQEARRGAREPGEPREPFEPVFRHCGLCSKCRERHDAFLEANIPDPTPYADERHVRA